MVKRKHEEVDAILEIPKKCHFNLLNEDLWKEVVQWLLEEDGGSCSVLPLVCKDWNALYKRNQLWRFSVFLETRRGRNLVVYGLCKRLCERSYYECFVVTDFTQHKIVLFDYVAGYPICHVLEGERDVQGVAFDDDLSFKIYYTNCLEEPEEGHFVWKLMFEIDEDEDDEIAFSVGTNIRSIWKDKGLIGELFSFLSYG